MRIPIVRCCSSDRTDVQNLTSAKNRRPEELNILLCLLEGAERRRQLQAKLNTLCPNPSPERCEPMFRQRRSGKRGIR